MKKLLISALILLVVGLVSYLVTPATVLLDGAMNVERKLARLEAKTVTVDQQHWAYLEGGEGPPLLLLHGFSADANNWTRLSRQLTKHYRVIAPDLLGFGASSAPLDIAYDITSQARRVFEFADAIGLEAFDVGGSSMGGYIAGEMAKQQSNRILSMLLLAPGGVLSAEPSEMFGMILQRNENPLIVRRIEDFSATYDFIFTKPPWLPAKVRRGFAERQLGRIEIYETVFAALRSETNALEVALNGAVVPTLIVWGAEDRVLDVSGASILAAVMPNASVEILDGVGHLPMIETPKQVATSYLAWREQL